MAKFLFVLQRQGTKLASAEFARIATHLQPPGFQGRQPLIIQEGPAALMVMNPPSTLVTNGQLSLVLGNFQRMPVAWHQVGQPMPDGAQLVLRHDAHAVEVCSHTNGARACWIYYDDQQLVLSSSQRAIVTYLQSFEPQLEAVSWMICNGNTGPGVSWDRRLKHLGPSARLHLNTNTWQLQHTHIAFQLEVERKPDSIRIHELHQVLSDSFDDFVMPDRFAVTLSGGYDSRVVLKHLTDRGIRPHTITWGLSHTLNHPQSDAAIARRIAAQLGLEHTFIPLDFDLDQDFDQMLRLFLQVGEGRIDHLYHGLDHFQLFYQLSQAGIEGFVRSDEVFGWLVAHTERDARIVIDCALPHDYRNLKQWEHLGLPEPVLPAYLVRMRTETVPMWRDRLYNMYRQPYVQSALHDLHYPFVEEINPLLSDRIVSFCSRLTDDQRTLKRIYKKTVTAYLLGLPIASITSHPKTENLIQSNGMVHYLRSHCLDKVHHRFGENVAKMALNSLRTDNTIANRAESSRWSSLYRLVPPNLKKAIRNNIWGYSLHPNALALRVVIAQQMFELLETDARVLAQQL